MIILNKNKLLILLLFLSILSCINKKEDVEFNKKITELIILNENDKALKLVDSAINNDKKEAYLYNIKLSILDKKCDFKNALKVFREMEKQDLELFTEQLVFKGIVLQKNNLKTEALECYKKSSKEYFDKIEKNPKNSQAILNYHFVNFLLGKTFENTKSELSQINVETKELEYIKIVNPSSLNDFYKKCN